MSHLGHLVEESLSAFTMKNRFLATALPLSLQRQNLKGGFFFLPPDGQAVSTPAPLFLDQAAWAATSTGKVRQ